MSNPLIVVKAAYDPEAGVWYVESSDLPGVNAEADSLELLAAKLPDIVADLIEASGDTDLRGEIPIELIAHTSTRVVIGEAA